MGPDKEVMGEWVETVIAMAPANLRRLVPPPAPPMGQGAVVEVGKEEGGGSIVNIGMLVATAFSLPLPLSAACVICLLKPYVYDSDGVDM